MPDVSSSSDLVWGRTLRLVSGNLRAFVAAGKRLDERYSEAKRRIYLEEQRQRGLDGAIDGSPIQQAYQRPVDEVRWSPCNRFAAAMDDLERIISDQRNALVQPPLIAMLSQEQAEEVLLLTWMLLEQKANERRPLTCEFQSLPWEADAQARWQCRALLLGRLKGTWRELATVAIERVEAINTPIDELSDLHVLQKALMSYLMEHCLDSSAETDTRSIKAIIAGEHAVWHAVVAVQRHFAGDRLPLEALAIWHRLLKETRRASPDPETVEIAATDLHKWVNFRMKEIESGRVVGKSVHTNDDGSDQLPALTKSARSTLLALNTFDAAILATVEMVGDAMDPHQRLSARTIGANIKALVGLNLAERPEGPTLGARLTNPGRRLASKIADGLPTDCRSLSD